MVNKMDTGADNSEQWYKRRVTRKNTVRRNLVPKSDQHEFRRNFFTVRVISDWNGLPDIRGKKCGQLQKPLQEA